MALPPIFVVVGAKIDQFEKAMGDVSKRLNAVDRDAQKAFSGFDKVGERLSTIGAGLTAAISLPLAGAGAAATKFATDFDSEMRKVTSLISGVTQKDFENLSKQTLQLSRDLGIDAVNATKGLYEAISAGVPKENAISFLADASKSAIAGATQTGVAVDVLTTFMAAYGEKAKDTRKLSDALFQAVNVGKFQFEDLAKSIGPAAQQASNLGVSYEELLAATSTLSLSSGGVSQAVTQIESAMRALLAPTKEMQAAFLKIGVESGTAAIKTFGFEGTLQKLRETTGGSAEAFNALFGRIEGATGALGLTGDNAKKAAADYATLKTASDGLGATQKALDERNKSTARQFEILTNSLKTTAIELGVQLLPAVNGLLQASKPLVDLLGLMVKGFAALPAPIQAVALGLTAVVVAAGPLALVAGQMLASFASLQAALITVNGAAAVSAATALPGLTTAMGAATLASTALSAALYAIPFVALAGGVAIVLDKLAQTKTAQENLARASKDQSDTLDYLNKKYREQQVELGNVSASTTVAKDKLLEFVQTMKSATGSGATAKAFDADRAAIEKFKQEIIESEKSTKLHNKALIELGLGHKIAGEGVSALEKAVKKADAEYNQAIKAYDNGKISLEQLGKAQENFIRAQDAADPERVAKRHETAYFSMLDRYDEMAKGIIKLSQEVTAAEKEVAASALKNAIDFGKAHDDMAKAAQKAVEIIVPLNERIPASVQAVIKANRDLALSYEIIGTKSPAELQKLVTETERAYELIVKATGKASTYSLEAWIKMRNAEIDLARRSGQVIPEEQLKALNTAQAQLDAALGKQTGSQKKWAQQVSTIINDLAKDIAKSTIGFFKGLFDFDGFNKKLREDSDKLREELGARTDALDEFRRTADEKIAASGAGYAQQLEGETSELRSALADRVAEFSQYESEVAGKLAELRGAESARLDEEISALAEKLREKEAAYEEYVYEVAAKEEDLRSSHAERLAEQLADLQSNLADKAEAYADYAAEANRSLARIGEDLNESISDDTRTANRKLEDENQDFARDSQKLTEDLRKAEKKGDKEATASLRRQLQQRTEDHEKSIRRIKEDLEEQTSDARRQAERQTSDLKSNLSIRTREHEQYIAESIAKQAEVAEENKKSLARQLKDLQDSLDKRTAELLAFRAKTELDIAGATAASRARLAKEENDLANSLDKRRADLEKYRRDAEQKIDALTEHYKDKQAEEVAALNLEFQNKLKEYDTYRKGVEKKLGELEAAHKGPLGRLKEMFTSVFSSASEAILRLASEEVIGVLFKRLGSLIDDTFPALAGKIKDILGIGSGVASGVGNAAGNAGGSAVGGVAGGVGGAASSAGGAAGDIASAVTNSLTGVVTAVASVATAISSIVGNFQMAAMNKTLDLIEHETRFTQIGVNGPKGIIDNQHAAYALFNSIDQFMIQKMGPSLNSIITWTEDNPFAAKMDAVYALIADKTNGYLERIAGSGVPVAISGGMSLTVNAPIYLDSRLIGNAIAEKNELSGGGI